MKIQATIRNCPVKFRFQCEKLWTELAATSDPSVRHCGRCGSDVHFCTTDRETIEHAKAGHCIAREFPKDGPGDLPRTMYLGLADHPSEPWTPEQIELSRWQKKESNIDDAIRSAKHSTRSCPECSFPVPDWRVACRVCGFEIGRAREASEET